MGFKSIQTKYILLVVGSIVASALLIGGVCVENSMRYANGAVSREMNLTCESYQHRYDASLQKAQSAVETAAVYASDRLESIQRFSTDAAYRDEYVSKLEDVMALETLDTNSVMSYYVRFSPDLLSFEKGFRFARNEYGGEFKRMDILKIQDYQENDDEHVGWYYEPISRGTTTWLEPYYNATFKKQMVSCVAPFYKDGVLAGVIGVDFDFSRLVDDLDELRIFENGYAFLSSPEGKIYFHPLYGEGTYIQDDVTEFDADLTQESSGNVLYGGISKGEEVDYAFRTLTNGMKLVLRAPESEIYANATNMRHTITWLVLGIVTLATPLTIFICRRITRPLRELTVVAAAMSKGDYSMPINVRSKDELGVLAHTLRRASVELKANAARMRQLAYKDALTGVRNKAAYEMEITPLEDEIAAGTARFGIALFDVNNLKEANDVYGHEQGDKVIKIGCNRICRSFPHSPVFRVGGDEFVAILKGDEVTRVDIYLKDFAERAASENASVEQPQDVVNVAVGVAFFDPELDASVQDVFNRADAEMYAAKEEMKSGR